MYTAVVTSFDRPPFYQEFEIPAPQGADEVLVDVVASGLRRRVRSQADGSHYTSTGELPLIPGVKAGYRCRPRSAAVGRVQRSRRRHGRAAR